MRLFRHKRGREIELDEILLDSSNLPAFNKGRVEGRLETPIRAQSVYSVGVVFLLIVCVFLYQLVSLQVLHGAEYTAKSENNRLDQTVLFASRGAILDRVGELLAWNVDSTHVQKFSEREYNVRRGIGHIVGYVSYPQRDKAGFYYRTEYQGLSGAEKAFSTILEGENGEQLIEADAKGEVISSHVVHMPKPGESISLSIDAEMSEALYDAIATTVASRGFHSGAGVIMDVHTGEVLAMASFPSYDPNVLMKGDDRATIQSYNTDDRLPLLNKVISGLYTPGSIVKPFVAYGALHEKIIDPLKTIFSAGQMIVPNPYFPDKPSVFTDWKAHGAVDMRRAIAVSSNIYFYTVGGGFENQAGLGITKLKKYYSLFGFGTTTGIELPGEVAGVVPDPEWKARQFDGDDWRLGDTYFTSIGQFGFQATLMEFVRAYAAIANGGILVTPTLIKGGQGATTSIGMPASERKVLIEGMRGSILDGTARAMNRSDVEFAGKTGTAELGSTKKFVNSWVAGFYPYQKPKYAFILLMEHGPRQNLFGASPAMAGFFNWVKQNKPEYLLDLDSVQDE